MRILFLMVFLGAATPAAAASLDARLRDGTDGWVGYDVAMVEGVSVPCCFSRRGQRDAACDLDADRSWGSSDDDAAPTGPQTLTIYAHRQGGRVDRVRALGASCAVRTPVVHLDGVAAADSAAWLAQWSTQHSGRHGEGESALAALAYQAGSEATAALVQLSAAPAPLEQRKNAVFWLGQTRGRDGAAVVERLARGDADATLREHAVFALSQSKAVDGYAVIVDIAHHDASDQVRAQSLFWMAQTGDARAAHDIRAVLDADRSSHVREQAVFALSQLHPGGDQALIDVLRSAASREVKEKAMFWLGQSGSDEAIAFLDQVLAAGAH